MTVFKTFWGIVNKYKATVILYTVILVGFGGINMSTNDMSTDFTASKPDIYIVNEDKDNKLSNNLVKYFEKTSVIKDIDNDEESINDAIFYRDINYYICIPNHYGEDVLKGKNPELKVKSSGDYNASLASMLLDRYVSLQNIYANISQDEDSIISSLNNTLKKESTVTIASTLDTSKTNKATYYFNFASYSIMACVIFIICLVLSSFHEKNVNKRTIVSSKNYQKLNRELLLASCLYSLIIWLLYCLIGGILLGNIMFSLRGLIYMLNCLAFTFTSLTLALMISTIVSNKDAVSGIVNVVALGSAFLCGAFVPAELLPEAVLKFAHVLPSYWFINSNNALSTLENINLSSLEPICTNTIVILVFGIGFIILNNLISRYKRMILKS